MTDDTTAGTGPITDGSNLLPPGSGEEGQNLNAPDAKALHNDMARILEEVKLPERREFAASGDAARKKEELAAVPVLIIPVPPTTTPKAAAGEIPALKTMPAGTGAEGARASASENSTTKPSEASPKARSSVNTVHTLKDDLQSVVRNTKMSIVHAVALEEAKRRGQEKGGAAVQKENTHSAMGIMLGIFALVLIIAGGLYGVYVMKLGQAPASSGPKDTPLFFADRTVTFPLGISSSAPDLKRTLAQALNAPRASLGSIMRIAPTIIETGANDAQSERPSTIEEFLKATGAQTPPDLIRSFRGDFFLGIHTAAETNMPVLIIPVSSYERAFAGMLAWEATINDDLGPLFAPVPALTIDESGLLVSRKFEDGVMQNFDVRVLKDDSGTVRLLYSFPTRNVLVIAESADSFAEILGRLRAARQL
ncbi:MAG: hypothetical protein Q7S05_03560 [bacterium]|nr:hypothetical protein [bacterium]